MSASTSSQLGESTTLLSSAALVEQRAELLRDPSPVYGAAVGENAGDREST